MKMRRELTEQHHRGVRAPRHHVQADDEQRRQRGFDFRFVGEGVGATASVDAAAAAADASRSADLTRRGTGRNRVRILGKTCVMRWKNMILASQLGHMFEQCAITYTSYVLKENSITIR